MRNFQYFLPFIVISILMTSCQKEIDLPVIEVDSALEYAYRLVDGVEATQEADHVADYINNCPDADFADLLESTNDAMAFSGFDYLNESKVFMTQEDDVLFYPVLRSSERNSGFLNLCVPFYRLGQSDDPVLLMEGPGIIAAGVLSDMFNGSGGGRGGGNIIPLVAENPGLGSFQTGYSASYFTQNGKVVIDYDSHGYNADQGTLRIIVTSTEPEANIDQSWLLKF